MQNTATKVLVVDACRDVRAWIAEVLLQHAYDVRTAQCGLEALDQMAVWTPDVLLTNVRMPMPGMSGLELMLRIRQVQREIGIIAMSEMETARDAAVATQLGADRFLLKPLKRGDLLAAIENACAEPSRASALAVPASAPATSSVRTVTHRWSPGGPPTSMSRITVRRS